MDVDASVFVRHQAANGTVEQVVLFDVGARVHPDSGPSCCDDLIIDIGIGGGSSIIRCRLP